MHWDLVNILQVSYLLFFCDLDFRERNKHWLIGRLFEVSLRGYQQNAPPLKNTITYNFFVNYQSQTQFLKMLRSMIFSIFENFHWILVIKKKVKSNCIFERWCVLLVAHRWDVGLLFRSTVFCYFKTFKTKCFGCAWKFFPSQMIFEQFSLIIVVTLYYLTNTPLLENFASLRTKLYLLKQTQQLMSTKRQSNFGAWLRSNVICANHRRDSS